MSGIRGKALGLKLGLTWVLMLAVALVAGCSKSEKDLLASAQGYIDKRDFKAATVQLKSLLQEHPESGEARFIYGRALLEMGDVAGAEAELNRALDNKYSEEIVVPVLAKALLASGQSRKLTEAYGKFEVADVQGAVELKVALAMAYAAQGKNDDAQASLNRALQIKADAPEALVALARLQAGDGKVDEALKTLTSLLTKSPTTIDGWMLKGDLLNKSYADEGSQKEAKRRYSPGTMMSREKINVYGNPNEK